MGDAYVLFICTDNSALSRMAEALFNSMAPCEIHSISGGSYPSESVDEKAQKVMEEHHLTIEGTPTRATQEMILGALRIIAMGRVFVCPNTGMERWDIPFRRGAPIEHYREVRDELAERVTALIKDVCLDEMPD